MTPLKGSSRCLVSASGVSYMWLSASKTGKSRMRDGTAAASWAKVGLSTILGPHRRTERPQRAPGESTGAGRGLGALEPRQHPGRGRRVEEHAGGRVDVADDRVLVDDGLTLVVAVGVAEVGVDGPDVVVAGE